VDVVKLIIEPNDGVAPLVAAIKNAKKSVEIAIFRFDRKDVELALRAAALAKRVRVTALIAFANRGGEKRLRNLELRFLDAGIIVARSSNDLVRYHNKYIVIDRRVLYVLSFNFTHLDIDRSRGFGIVTTNATWIREAVRLFRADCGRTTYAPKADTFVVSPANSRKVLSGFLERAKTQLLIYDPKISDKDILRILAGRAKAGVEIKVIGSVAGRHPFEVQKLSGRRLHTRTIIRDRRQAFVGSQSLRGPELDSRRELGLIVQDAGAVRKLLDTFESDWVVPRASETPAPEKKSDARAGELAAASDKKTEKDAERAEEKKTAIVEKAVQVLTKELDPLATSVKKAVRVAVARAGEVVLQDKDVKDTMKKVVKQAVKEAVREAVEEADDARGARRQP
jgi:phosphatidylserine/phosphatidylglycerophosphate/cardiolipin synthase-like enzyme